MPVEEIDTAETESRIYLLGKLQCKATMFDFNLPAVAYFLFIFKCRVVSKKGQENRKVRVDLSTPQAVFW